MSQYINIDINKRININWFANIGSPGVIALASPFFRHQDRPDCFCLLSNPLFLFFFRHVRTAIGVILSTFSYISKPVSKYLNWPQKFIYNLLFSFRCPYFNDKTKERRWKVDQLPVVDYWLTSDRDIDEQSRQVMPK